MSQAESQGLQNPYSWECYTSWIFAFFAVVKGTGNLWTKKDYKGSQGCPRPREFQGMGSFFTCKEYQETLVFLNFQITWICVFLSRKLVASLSMLMSLHIHMCSEQHCYGPSYGLLKEQIHILFQCGYLDRGSKICTHQRQGETPGVCWGWRGENRKAEWAPG